MQSQSHLCKSKINLCSTMQKNASEKSNLCSVEKKTKPLSRAQTKSDLCKLKEKQRCIFLSYGDIALMNFPILEKPALHFSILG